MANHKIIDEYTDLLVSRQRKWALRNPDKLRVAKAAWKKTPKGKASAKRYRNKIKGVDL